MSKEKPLLILFDGNALVHRAFHALPPLSIMKTGEMVNAVQGFASTLLKLLKENKPDYWAIAFDRAAPTFRHEMFEDYKAQRPKTPPELVTQIERVHQLANAFNLPVFEMDGFEADDLIGTISTQAGDKGIDTLIVTGDNDMLQVVRPGIRVMAPRRGFADTVVYDTPAVKEKYGLEPEQLISYKALVGDPSDNIPGVRGIGDKTAVKLLQQFTDLEGVYSHLDQVEPERIRNLLRESHEAALQNEKLAAIVTEVPVTFDPDACRVSSYDRNSVVELFRELGFSAMLSRLPEEIGQASAPAPIPAAAAAKQEPSGAGFIIVDSAQKLDELALRLSYAGTFAASVTPAGDNPMQSGLVGISVSPARGESYYIPIGHATLDLVNQLPL
ncbi:MAG: 5'-3' exonuclease H3TH domain-containing protein, partial [Dehalococcoidia bacterium]